MLFFGSCVNLLNVLDVCFFEMREHRSTRLGIVEWDPEGPTCGIHATHEFHAGLKQRYKRGPFEGPGSSWSAASLALVRRCYNINACIN